VDDEINELFRAFDAGELDEEPGDSQAPLTAAERDRLGRVAAFVATALDAPLPSPGLRTTVLAAVRAQATTDAQPGPVPVVAPARQSDADHRSAHRIRPRRRRRWQLVAAATVAAVAAAATVTIVVRRPAATRVELAGAKLKPTAGALAPDAEGEVVVFPARNGEIIKVDAEHLPVPTNGQIYQCWLVGPGDTPDAQVRVAIGTFRTADGTILIEFPSAVDRTNYPTFAITLEPDDGDPRQNGPMIVEATPVPDEPSASSTSSTSSTPGTTR